MAISFDFGSTLLNNGSTYLITKTNAFGAPEKALTTLERARRDGNVLLFDRLKGRDIDAEGVVKAASSALLKTAMDDLKKLLIMGKQPLKITEDAAYRQWSEAVLRNVNISREATDLTQAAFSLQFATEEPYAVSGETDTLLSATAETAGFKSHSITPQGSYLSYPTITLTINSINPNTSDVEIGIGNPATSQFLRITDTFTTGDVLTIDTFNRQAFLNTELISPDGMFPEWIPGAGNHIDYSDTATTRDYDLTVSSERKWL